MSNFYSRFLKVFAVLIVISSGAYSACVDVTAELRRGSRIASYSWQPIRNSNIIIFNTDEKIVATIFTLRYEHAGKIGVYFTSPHGRISNWPFEDVLSAKEWVIGQARGYDIALATVK